jgi:hypothetical protein
MENTGIMNDHLKAFLEMNLPKPGKKSKVVLGVTEKSLAGSIKDGLGYECDASEIVLDLVRGVRLFGDKLLKQLKEGDLERAQLGLGHSYSRGKVKFNVHRSDNMIMQAIALLDQMDKDVNTFAMRIRFVTFLLAIQIPLLTLTFITDAGLESNLNLSPLTNYTQHSIGSGTRGTSPSWSRLSTTTTSLPSLLSLSRTRTISRRATWRHWRRSPEMLPRLSRSSTLPVPQWVPTFLKST